MTSSDSGLLNGKGSKLDRQPGCHQSPSQPFEPESREGRCVTLSRAAAKETTITGRLSLWMKKQSVTSMRLLKHCCQRNSAVFKQL